ncbi:MAG: AAA family ATPase [Candidatus Coatesbacteria bacterium]|nr:AAA family ATPase [Candidatus Coatesbacteria bacterium]
MGFKEDLDVLIRARYPLIYIKTWEEQRVETILAEIAAKRGKKFFCWTITRGIHDGGIGSRVAPQKENKSTKDPLSVLQWVFDQNDPSLILLKDFHPYLKDPEIIRKTRDLFAFLKSSFNTVLIMSSQDAIPSELEKEITEIEFGLPDQSELMQLLNATIEDVNKSTDLKIAPSDPIKEKITQAALGLTLLEAENVFAKSIVTGGRLDEDDIADILEEKKQIIRKSGVLDYYPAGENFGDIGGLEELKGWLGKRAAAFSIKAKQFGLPAPRGILLIGVQGCGKSLCAKAVASVWGVPLTRLDMGKVFSSLVGSSEENMRKAIDVAESVAPAILWLDEIDKSFAGMAGGGASDAGTASRVLGTFLTWLQEKTSPVFVIATANDISSLPPELLRKGRLDEIFFVDLPSQREREEIIGIHLKKRDRDPREFNVPILAQKCPAFSGAEIEQCIVSALYDVFDQGKDLNEEAIIKSMGELIPLSRMMQERIDELRDWASARTRPASLNEDEKAEARGRRLEL